MSVNNSLVIFGAVFRSVGFYSTFATSRTMCKGWDEQGYLYTTQVQQIIAFSTQMFLPVSISFFGNKLGMRYINRLHWCLLPLAPMLQLVAETSDERSQRGVILRNLSRRGDERFEFQCLRRVKTIGFLRGSIERIEGVVQNGLYKKNAVEHCLVTLDKWAFNTLTFTYLHIPDFMLLAVLASSLAGIYLGHETTGCKIQAFFCVLSLLEQGSFTLKPVEKEGPFFTLFRGKIAKMYWPILHKGYKYISIPAQFIYGGYIGKIGALFQIWIKGSVYYFKRQQQEEGRQYALQSDAKPKFFKIPRSLDPLLPTVKCFQLFDLQDPCPGTDAYDLRVEVATLMAADQTPFMNEEEQGHLTKRNILEQTLGENGIFAKAINEAEITDRQEIAIKFILFHLRLNWDGVKGEIVKFFYELDKCETRTADAIFKLAMELVSSTQLKEGNDSTHAAEKQMLLILQRVRDNRASDALTLIGFDPAVIQWVDVAGPQITRRLSSLAYLHQTPMLVQLLAFSGVVPSYVQGLLMLSLIPLFFLSTYDVIRQVPSLARESVSNPDFLMRIVAFLYKHLLGNIHTQNKLKAFFLQEYGIGAYEQARIDVEKSIGTGTLDMDDLKIFMWGYIKIIYTMMFKCIDFLERRDRRELGQRRRPQSLKEFEIEMTGEMVQGIRDKFGVTLRDTRDVMSQIDLIVKALIENSLLKNIPDELKDAFLEDQDEQANFNDLVSLVLEKVNAFLEETAAEEAAAAAFEAAAPAAVAAQAAAREEARTRVAATRTRIAATRTRVAAARTRVEEARTRAEETRARVAAEQAEERARYHRLYGEDSLRNSYIDRRVEDFTRGAVRAEQAAAADVAFEAEGLKAAAAEEAAEVRTLVEEPAKAAALAAASAQGAEQAVARALARTAAAAAVVFEAEAPEAEAVVLEEEPKCMGVFCTRYFGTLLESRFYQTPEGRAEVRAVVQNFIVTQEEEEAAAAEAAAAEAEATGATGAVVAEVGAAAQAAAREEARTRVVAARTRVAAARRRVEEEAAAAEEEEEAAAAAGVRAAAAAQAAAREEARTRVAAARTRVAAARTRVAAARRRVEEVARVAAELEVTADSTRSEIKVELMKDLQGELKTFEGRLQRGETTIEVGLKKIRLEMLTQHLYKLLSTKPNDLVLSGGDPEAIKAKWKFAKRELWDCYGSFALVQAGFFLEGR